MAPEYGNIEASTYLQDSFVISNIGCGIDPRLRVQGVNGLVAGASEIPGLKGLRVLE